MSRKVRVNQCYGISSSMIMTFLSCPKTDMVRIANLVFWIPSPISKMITKTNQVFHRLSRIKDPGYFSQELKVTRKSPSVLLSIAW